MRRSTWFLFPVMIVTVSTLSPLSTTAAESKGTVVDLDGLKSRTPADWKAEEPQGSFRLKQFSIPHAEGDKSDAELVLFKLGGGSQANIDRWKSQWTPPEGKKLADAAMVKEIKIAGRPAVLLDIEGTYRTPNFDPKHKGKALRDYRMLAIYFDGPENAYQIKFYGPAKTIEKQKSAFESWYQGFK